MRINQNFYGKLDLIVTSLNGPFHGSRKVTKLLHETEAKVK